MKIKSVIAASALSVLLGVNNSSAVTITDNFHGGVPNNSAFAGQDIVGTFDGWDVSHMDVNYDSVNNQLVVDIFALYFDNVGRAGTELGDLFISDNGWSPFGTAPYDDDTAFNGEAWEYAAVMSDHGEGIGHPGANYVGQNGTVALYAVNQAQIELSNLPGHDFREFQEVQYNANGQQAVATGTWSIDDMAGDYERLRFVLNLPQGFNVANLGFHWTMTCGNDVIEGSAGVPEPATLALLGVALLGAVPSRRRFRK